jgi:Conserved TM helix
MDWTHLAEGWAPMVGGAVLVLVIAWFAAGIARGLIGRAVNTIPFLKAQGQGLEFKATLGARVGEVGYWLIMLIGVIAALTILNLTEVVQPLRTMLSNFLTYVPDLVGAALIFFIGSIVAHIAQKLVVASLEAVDLESVMARLGLDRETGAGLVSAVGPLVYVLIIIPVAIQAFQTLHVTAISGPALTVLTTLMDAIPNVVAAGIVLTVGLLIGRWFGGVTERLLPATGVDKAFAAVRALSSADGSAAEGPTASKIIGGLVTFAVVAFTAIQAAQLLHFAAIATILENIIDLAGRVILGAVIIVVGAVIGDMLSNAIGRSVNEGEKFAGSLAKWATIALATAMGLKAMGIADEIVILAFGLILGSAAVAAALAFGLGARDAAGKLADRWVDRK